MLSKKEAMALFSGGILGFGLARCIQRFSQHSLVGKRTLSSLQYATSKLLLSEEGKDELAKKPIYGADTQTSEARILRSPNPDWKPKDGANQNQPKDDTIYIDPNDYKKSLYDLLISGVTPRPIALVSSKDAEDHLNVAPFSYFNVICHSPPMIAVSICRKPSYDSKKDTLRNIEQTGEFVVNLISDWYLEAANHTCGNFETGVSELDAAGLSEADSKIVSVPGVKESAYRLECRVRSLHPIRKGEQAWGDEYNPQTIEWNLQMSGGDTDKNRVYREVYPKADDNSRQTELGPVSTTLVIAQVVQIHVNSEVYNEEEGVCDILKLRPVARCGGCLYSMVDTLTPLPRPAGRDLNVDSVPTPKP